MFSNKGDLVVNDSDEYVVPENLYHPIIVFESRALVFPAGAAPLHTFFKLK